MQVAVPVTPRGLYKAVEDSAAVSNGQEFQLALDPKGLQLIPPNHDNAIPLENGSFVFIISSSTNTNSAGLYSGSLDSKLKNKDGRVKRENAYSCAQHGMNGMCEHCRPLEPFEEAAQGDAKHLSLHAYLRKLSSFRSPPPAYEYSITDRHLKYCRSLHAPYPQGICTKCQPPAIALQRQSWRCTDHVEFGDGGGMVDRFIGGWRRSGTQRFAWLIGRFEEYEGVPLGVKALVHALYEPPQENAIDGFRLCPDNESNKSKFLREILKREKMEIVGMLYTDLQPDPQKPSLVLNKRRTDTFFLSSPECYFIAQQQLLHPTHTDGVPFVFSRFLTCILSGDAQGGIDMSCYQVSLQAEALVRTGVVLPSSDPGYLVLGSEEAGAFVPSVLYTKENEYGVKVPYSDDHKLPVEYLIVTLSHGFSSANTTVGLDINAMLSEKTVEKTIKQTVDTVVISDDDGWACEHCTFINTSTSSDAHCDMCALPRLH